MTPAGWVATALLAVYVGYLIVWVVRERRDRREP